MKSFKTLCTTFLILALVLPVGLKANEKGRQRLQELFIWKVSDYLGLNAEEDKSFRKIVEDLNQKKQAASLKMKELVQKMESEKSESKTKALLKEYEENLEDYLETQESEIESLRVVFDPQRMAKYLVVKTKLTENLRVLMGSGVNQEKKVLAKPKVKIEN